MTTRKHPTPNTDQALKDVREALNRIPRAAQKDINLALAEATSAFEQAAAEARASCDPEKVDRVLAARQAALNADSPEAVKEAVASLTAPSNPEPQPAPVASSDSSEPAPVKASDDKAPTWFSASAEGQDSRIRPIEDAVNRLNQTVYGTGDNSGLVKDVADLKSAVFDDSGNTRFVPFEARPSKASAVPPVQPAGQYASIKTAPQRGSFWNHWDRLVKPRGTYA